MNPVEISESIAGPCAPLSEHKGSVSALVVVCSNALAIVVSGCYLDVTDGCPRPASEGGP